MDRFLRWKATAFLRLNSFCAVGHHWDVTLLSFTISSPFVAAIHVRFQGNKKTLLTLDKQGVEILFRFFTCLPPADRGWSWNFARDTLWTVHG
jgi:hypothetical protein